MKINIWLWYSVVKNAVNVSFQLNGLIRLHLSGNKIKKFDVKSDCLRNLNVLDLSGNELFTLSIHLWEVLPSLTTIDISSNPLNCDCDIMPAIKELSRSPTSSLNQVKLLANWFHEVNLTPLVSPIYDQKSPLPHLLNCFNDIVSTLSRLLDSVINNTTFLISMVNRINPFLGFCDLCGTRIT